MNDYNTNNINYAKKNINIVKKFVKILCEIDKIDVVLIKKQQQIEKNIKFLENMVSESNCQCNLIMNNLQNKM